MKSLFVRVGIALAALALIAPAAAEAAKKEPKLLVPAGMAAEVGGGVHTFLDQDATDVTKAGGMWTARLVIGTRSYVAGEAAYIGTAQAIDAIGIDNQAMLLSNGVEGLFRVNVATGAWQPYALAGFAWRHYSLQNTAFNTSSIEDSDNVSAIPVGIGLAYRTGGLVVDLRATYNNAFGQDLIPEANLSALNVGLKLGWEF